MREMTELKIAGKSDLTAILLAGGKSRRMGCDKAMLPFEGGTLLEWQIRKLRQLHLEQILISGGGYCVPGAQTVPDIFPDCGPIGGIYSCMQQAHGSACLVLSVDTPLVPVSVLEKLYRKYLDGTSEITILRTEDGGIEPLIGIYHTGIAELLLQQIKARDLSVRHLATLASTAFLNVDDELACFNCNRPEDYQRLGQKRP